MKHKIYLSFIALSFNAIAQQNPTNSSPLLNGNNNAQFWSRGGNIGGVFNNNNNIFGTLWNSPIYTQTAGQTRMKLNGNVTYPVGGTGGNRNGFLLLTNNPTIWTGGPGLMSANEGAFSLLHLVGDDGNLLQTFGFRQWMRNGITISNNFDAGFIGVRKMPNLQGGNDDVSDFVIGWSDNGGQNPALRGPDNLVFNFTNGNGSGNDDLSGNSVYGRETMRHTSVGNIGIGPRFNNTWQPQSTLHQHQENSSPSWMQISNQLSGGTASATAPTAITGNDGLRWGINGANTAYFYNQENNHLLFGTNHVVGFGERFRITHIGAPNTTNPGGIAQDVTRVSISHNPANPVTRPLSLLHLGYNTGALSANPNSTDGWRPWMDIGMFASNGTDNVYLGLKDENGPLGDRQDAVLSWGDNQASGLPPGNGPDNFRFIFTSTPAASSPGSVAAKSTNGLEALRMYPTLANGVYTGIGGDPSANLYSAGSQNPNNTLEVNSWGATTAPGGSSGLRFTNLTTVSPTTANPGNGVLSVNAQGDVIYVPGGGAGAADNGLSTNGPTPGAIHLGQNSFAPGDPARLLNNRQVPMYGKNIYFTGQDSIAKAAVYIGYTPNAQDQGKLNVRTTATNLNITTAAIKGINRSFYGGAPMPGIEAIGVLGISDTLQTQPRVSNIGVKGIGKRWYPVGVYGEANTNQTGAPSIGVQGEATGTNGINIGGQFTGRTGTGNNTGVLGRSFNAATGTGVRGEAQGGNVAYGGYFTAVSATQNIAIYGEILGAQGNNPPSATQPDLAGFFNGDVYISGFFGPSDQNLKQNIDTITNALAIVQQLSPKSFEYKHSSYPGMHLPQGIQYGLIAQEVETVLPALVTSNTQPAKLDSAGNVMIPAVNFKGLEYQQLIPFLIKAIQEQQSKIDSLITKTSKQDSVNTVVQSQIAALATQINGCCSNAQTKTYGNSNPLNVNQLDVELSDKDAVVLNQNVPNPFAEQTTITYNIPASIAKAQILFYNSSGQLIQTADITTRGKGKLNVFASDLSSGLYHYTLIADGRIIDSKKMIRE